jgi:hypothetical protein
MTSDEHSTILVVEKLARQHGASSEGLWATR